MTATVGIDHYEFSFDTSVKESGSYPCTELREIDGNGFGESLETAIEGMKEATLTLKGAFPPVRSLVPMPTFTEQEIRELEEVRRATVLALCKLEALHTAQSIYNLFKDEGITGTRNNPLDCPVSNWLESTTGYDISVQKNCVGKPYSYVSNSYAPNETEGPLVGYQSVNHVEIYLADLPMMIQRFIDEFDAGNFPFIDRNEHAL